MTALSSSSRIDGRSAQPTGGGGNVLYLGWPDIDDTIFLLATHFPNELRRLQAELPQLQPVLHGMHTLQLPGGARLTHFGTTVLTALTVFQVWSAQKVQGLEAQIRRTHRFSSVGRLSAVVGGVTVVSLAGSGEPGLTVIGGLISLAGAAADFMIQRLDGSLGAGGREPTVALGELRGVTMSVREKDERLQYWMHRANTPSGEIELTRAISEGNALCRGLSAIAGHLSAP